MHLAAKREQLETNKKGNGHKNFALNKTFIS
jgi:hypothetical protein